MKGIWAACAVGAVQVFLVAGVAQAVGARFFEGFDTFDDARWSKGDHALGRSQLDPANVTVEGGNLRIALPARTLKVARSSATTSTATAPTPRT